jgi:hypothetical protein
VAAIVIVAARVIVAVHVNAPVVFIERNASTRMVSEPRFDHAHGGVQVHVHGYDHGADHDHDRGNDHGL